MANTNNYLQVFRQHGGGSEYPVFRGARFYQTGQGFGDFLRGLWRTIVPIAADLGGTFLRETVRHHQGYERLHDEPQEAPKSWGDAAKEGLASTAHEAIDTVLRKKQSGKGRKRRRVYKRKIPKQIQTWNF